jgi:hypothetical protein
MLNYVPTYHNKTKEKLSPTFMSYDTNSKRRERERERERKKEREKEKEREEFLAITSVSRMSVVSAVLL